MTFPFESLTLGARETGLVIAVLIGIAFGFVLERAGFGRADKLSAQFFLRDMTVFKVMFTAIVTAMLGLVLASSLGLADLRAISESIVSWTYVWPMLIGGFVLGLGFIISGYCPGTSIVSAASGNVDGVFAFGGVVTGTFIYSELLQIPAFARFHESGAKGAWFLYDLLPVAPELLAAAIAVMAVMAFIGAEKVERLVNNLPAAAAPRSRRLAWGTVFAGAAAAIVVMAVPRPILSEPPAAKPITAGELSRRMVDEPWSIRIVDTRMHAKDRIAGAEVVDPVNAASIPDDGRMLVVVGDPRRLPPHARVLAGGMAAWKSDPLAVAMASGAPPAAAAPAAPRGTFVKPKKKGGGCSA